MFGVASGALLPYGVGLGRVAVCRSAMDTELPGRHVHWLPFISVNMTTPLSFNFVPGCLILSSLFNSESFGSSYKLPLLDKHFQVYCLTFTPGYIFILLSSARLGSSVHAYSRLLAKHASCTYPYYSIYTEGTYSVQYSPEHRDSVARHHFCKVPNESNDCFSAHRNVQSALGN